MSPHRLSIQVQWLNDIQVLLSCHYAWASNKTNFKRVLSLMPKKKYVVPYITLNFYLGHGIRLTKVPG